MILKNLSYQKLFEEEIINKETVTEFGAVAVDTGKFTGRSPEDKYFVAPNKNIWWRDEKNPTAPNKPMSLETWENLFQLVNQKLKDGKYYEMDGILGARKKYQLRIKLKTESAWQAHFFKNMFLKTEGTLPSKIDFEILAAPSAVAMDWEKLGLNSEVFVAINLKIKQMIIGGTWYGGEIKKGMFSVANYLLPLKGVGSFHCSANIGENGDTALFFGLSGTGKTTLSHDEGRWLIGDDEHGWDDEGIFNLEGGCYAKVIHLSKEAEPHIFGAIKRNALLENVVVDEAGRVDFSSTVKTENTRMSYPIEHIANRVKGKLVGNHAQKIIFLTCDSFGVLPPVAKLSLAQAKYWYLSGYTAKIAGTERGINEPKATFSACFGQPFLPLKPQIYADILAKKIKEHHCQVYLVNTGWINGGYGVGKRIELKITRQIVREILAGNLDKAEYEIIEPFGLRVPTQVIGVERKLLKPKNLVQAQELHKLFEQNFKRFER